MTDRNEIHVALVSIGHCPSLALRNLECYCRSLPSLAAGSFSRHDFDVRGFQTARRQSAQQWSWASAVDDAVSALQQERPDVIGFSCYLWSTDFSLHLAQLLKQLNPALITVLGGPDAGPRAPELLRHPAIDFVIEGDGEIPFGALLTELTSSRPDLTRVPSLRYLEEDQLVSSPPPADPPDMSRLAGVYEPIPSSQDVCRWGWPHILYETLRGCPYRCSYCMYGKTPLNAKPVDLAVAELVALLKQGLVVEIIDPTFTTYQKRAKEILRRLGEHSYDGALYFEAYPDSIDSEMAELMAAARVATVGIGFQTISADGLRAVRRPKNLAKFECALRLLAEHRVAFYVDVIYGLPETDLDDFLATIDYLYSLGDYGIVMYRLLGLPGSPMMDDVGKHGLVFNPQPPYELLQSNMFSLDDVVFCERFRHAFEGLTGQFHRTELLRMADQVSGQISRLVELWLESAECPDTLSEHIATLADRPASSAQAQATSSITA